MSSNKRPASVIGNIVSQSAQLAKRTAVETSNGTPGSSTAPSNPFLSRPTPEVAIKTFLIQARSTARKRPPTQRNQPVEIEARLGTIVSPYGSHDMRALSSGAKQIPIKGVNRVFHAFVCNISPSDGQNANAPKTNFEGGITRSNYLKWTSGGVSEMGPLTSAFSVQTNKHESESATIKSQLSEVEYVETVFCYLDQTRINFPHNPPQSNVLGRGHQERKEKLSIVDIALPAAPYDLRLQLASEVPIENRRLESVNNIPNGWNTKRVKRRRSYSRIDKSFAWRVDVTEVTSSLAKQGTQPAEVGYEIEMELSSSRTQELIQTSDEAAAHKLAENLARQLWFMLQQINPTHDVLEVDEFLQVHPDAEATKLAIGQCGTIKRFIESGCQSWRSAIAPGGGAAEASDGGECKPPRNFIGCMPVNFSRHNIEEVQRSDGDESNNGSSSVGYYLSEKTDGVRYLMVFTGKTVVLIDRASHETKKAFQPKLHSENPFSNILSAVKPGTILDGEVVVHRKLRRPIFIVFDVLANSASEPILHLPFEQRLRHLKAASFVKKDAGVDVFNPASVNDPKVPLPLVRKNFVKRVDLDHLLSNVHEERGMRIYKHGETHHHLTDGIIFQPNMPYVCGTDVNLLKWKYLDTVTIDVEILPPKPNFGRNQSNDNEDILRVGVMGEDSTTVDMTRYLRLPSSERHRLEADRNENGSKIAEVGFDPTTGEWYYRTMRPDKVAPNHISTVLGTLLELAESLSTEELRYRMSIPSGTRDTYAKDVRNMQKQLLEHQRRKNKAAAGGSR
ncbi:hypothetical protein HJC23_009229 [Cyclotella cryptica]|uniref:mRNA 5'-phosphatase n=1 Tax=Cyclotella cryptica TaxID=29204 RepID=A0ABD3NHI8_9STRA|eukprot:CCRYP_021061-RA/>CCRYP_021061-RA protein AED:0.00 eAED:0.00 QI:71/-1/1/1/-1/1/1/141/789